MRDILVTGATGFIGYEVSKQLIQQGYRPRLMVRRPIRGMLLNSLGADLKQGDLSRPDSLKRLATGVDSVMATYSLLGPLFAVFRPVAAFFSGITIGILNRIFNPEEKKEKQEEHDHPPQPSNLKIIEVFRYGFFELAEDIGKWLIVGVLIGGILTVAIPQDLVMRFLSYPILHFVIMLVLAIPLYVCATGSIPIAAVLHFWGC